MIKIQDYFQGIREHRTIRRSGLFDRDYYLRGNLDVARSCMDPVRHYLRYGWKEGRNPSLRFDTNWYLQTYPDVQQAGMNPLVHYIRYGAAEGRGASPATIQADVPGKIGRDGSAGIGRSLSFHLSVFFRLLAMSLRHPRTALKLLSFQKCRSAYASLLGRHEDPQILLTRYEKIFERKTDRQNSLLAQARSSIGPKGDIYIFPIIDWHFRIQRPQHLATHLASRGYRVFYFSTVPLLDEGEHLFEIREQVNDRVFLCGMRGIGTPQNIYRESMTPAVLQAYRNSLLDLMDQTHARRVCAVIHLPYWKPLVESLPGVLYGYDCMDHHIGFHENKSEIPEDEIQLMKEADFVVVSSEYLYQNVSLLRDTVLIRNGTDYSFFSSPPESSPFRKDRPVIGYIGAIAEWFDIELVVRAARQYPEWKFIMVGGISECKVRQAGNLPNLEWVGEIPYHQVPAYLHGFDVAIIPFQIVELTKATNPVKVYEYLSAGKPVVAAALPELLLLEEYIQIGRSREEFLEKLSAAIKTSSDQHLAQKRREWAKQQDWAFRARDFDRVLQKSYPRVSIVVLSYGNSELTRACLESIERNTFYPNYEVVIVDNASDHHTIRYLEEYVSGHRGYRLVCNSQNHGFAGGNNIGIKASEGDYIVLLNNDTYVAPGWLGSLIYPFLRNPRIGLTGPVTNNIGNEAKIEIAYRDMRQMEVQAAAYIQKHRGQMLFLDRIAFFCVAVSRRVVEEIGLLDERFGLGFFEDDDYCRRAQEAGYEIAVVEDAFVHHHLSASFSRLGEYRDQLFEKNKQIFESKWGRWDPHVYRMAKS